MGKKATSPNTGLSVKRAENTFTADWKIATKSMKTQKLRYRTFNGSTWSDYVVKDVGKSATTYSFNLSVSSKITKVEVQTQALRSGKYKSSDWALSSATFQVEAPPVPTLTVSNDSANATTFSWSIETDDTNAKWYYRCMYRTKCTRTPDSASDWSNWAHASNSSYSYTDSTLGTTRIFQLKAVGPGGESTIVTQRHVIATAPVATWADKNPVTLTKKSSYYAMTYSCNIKGSSYTVDAIVPQYYIGTPDSDMSCPSAASWQDGTTYNYSNGQTAYAIAINTSSKIGTDECLWARVKTEHDGVDSASTAYRVLTGSLDAPDLTISMSTPTASGFTVSVTVNDWETNVPGVFMQVFLEKASKTGEANYIKIGTIANGSASATISSSLNITGETGYAIHIRTVTSDGKSMKSGYTSLSTSMPSAPTLSSVVPTTVAGKVYLSWTNNWSDATGVKIAWTDDPDNWMSNDEPEEYEINETVSNWYITGLDTGKTWYFRVRSVKVEDDNETLSPWSADVPIDLSSAPAVPVLYLSDETITEKGMVTAYWSYISTDGTGQIAADVVLATYSGGTWSYGRSVGSTTTAQHIDIKAKDQKWKNGTTVYLALQTRAGSGGMSDYSSPVQLTIAADPKVNITTTSLSNSDTATEYFYGDGVTTDFITSYKNITTTPIITLDDVAYSPLYNYLLANNGNNLVDNSGNKLIATIRNVVSYENGTIVFSSAPAAGVEIKATFNQSGVKVLKSLPLTATITTTSASDLTIAIERANTYPMERPDGSFTDGPEGETVYVTTIPAESTNSISIAKEDLIGRLDDGAFYYLVATATNKFGRSVEKRIRFKVHWTHQALTPTATVAISDGIASITPIAPSGTITGDLCDIYRLSIDKPELIIKGAAWGTQYVDPYPTLGDNGGYRIVFMSLYDDYITKNDTFAMNDYGKDEGVYHYVPETIIDYGGNQVSVMLDMTLQSNWEKDFQETRYLGGSIKGDWNLGVSRTESITATTIRFLDQETISLLHELAEYAGICHVRMPDGSNFHANVQVAINTNLGNNPKTAECTFTITRVEGQGLDGMTYADWSAMQ